MEFLKTILTVCTTIILLYVVAMLGKLVWAVTLLGSPEPPDKTDRLTDDADRLCKNEKRDEILKHINISRRKYLQIYPGRDKDGDTLLYHLQGVENILYTQKHSEDAND